MYVISLIHLRFLLKNAALFFLLLHTVCLQELQVIETKIDYEITHSKLLFVTRNQGVYFM